MVVFTPDPLVMFLMYLVVGTTFLQAMEGEGSLAATGVVKSQGSSGSLPPLVVHPSTFRNRTGSPGVLQCCAHKKGQRDNDVQQSVRQERYSNCSPKLIYQAHTIPVSYLRVYTLVRI
jgi:hypothetical protein